MKAFLYDIFLAWRYFRPKRNAVSVITCISLAGVAIGVAVLIIVQSVMTGFISLMEEKLLETTAHIQLSPNFFNDKRYIENPKKIIKIIEEKGLTAAAVVETSGLLQYKKSFMQNPKMILGIQPKKENTKISLQDKIIRGKYSLEHGEIIISSLFSSQTGIDVGDKILIHTPNKLMKMVEVKPDGSYEMNKNSDLYLPEEFTVSGIFSYGEYNFDNNFMFTSLISGDELIGIEWGAASSIYVWTENPFDMKELIAELQNDFPGMDILSWKERYAQLRGVLAVEKNVMFFLLLFISIVAAFSISNTLITVAVQKTREIGILKALGAKNGTVMRIFLFQGFIVGLLGTLSGFALGIAIIHWRNNILNFASRVFNIELFPKKFYHFNELPAEIVSYDLLKIAILAVLLCTLGALLPAWRAARQVPAQALRYE